LKFLSIHSAVGQIRLSTSWHHRFPQEFSQRGELWPKFIEIFSGNLSNKLPNQYAKD